MESAVGIGFNMKSLELIIVWIFNSDIKLFASARIGDTIFVN